MVDGAYSTASKCDRLVALKVYRNVEGDDGLMRTGWTGDRENPLNDVRTFAATTPLPSTWLMLLSSFIGLGFFAYRGTKKNAAALAAV